MQEKLFHPLTTVTGRVVDSAGKPIAGALVSVVSMSASGGFASGYIKTNKEGRFQMQMQNFSPYALRVKAPGFVDLERPKMPSGPRPAGRLFLKDNSKNDLGNLVLEKKGKP